MNSLSERIEKLNEAQRRPVMETEGAVLVLAGAGSGKTSVLTTRIAYLIEEKGVSPFHILAITFTNKAAKEMSERIDAICDSTGMWVSTIHSMCTRILRKNADRLGFNDKFSIYSETERNTILKKSFQECDYDDDKLLKNCKYHVGNAKMLGLSPEAYAVYQKQHGDVRNIEEVEKVYARYEAHLKENNAMDFDDLLLYTKRLLQENDDVREYYAGKFRYVLVDEFQDTNAVQFEIIKMLSSVHGNLFAVGDDDQSIYGWRGAEISNILHFERSFPQAQVFKLEQNYRSTKTVLSLANAVIHNNVNRKDKTLWTNNAQGADPVTFEAEEETEEALFTARTISNFVRQGGKYSDFAVLMRINALTRSYEQEFAKYSIPYKVFGGFKFFERKEIKDMLAYLRIANNPFDSEAIERIINFPKRGIGDKTIQVLSDYASQEGLTLYDSLLDIDLLELNNGTKTKLKTFARLLKDIILKAQEVPVNELVTFMIQQTGLREAYADSSDESITKRANIDEFESSVNDYVRLNPDAKLEDYLNQVALSSDLDEMDDTNYVTLATIHAVKGLEFKNVFLCGLEDGTMPTSRALDDEDDMEEERRLMYVGITRAQERIYFTRSKSRYLYGKREPTVRSCFLKELKGLLHLQEERPAYKRYQGDFDEYTYANSTPQRSSYKQNDDSAFRTFGGAKSGMGRGNSYTRRSTQSGNTFSMAKKFTSASPVGGGSKAELLVAGTKVSHPKFGHGVVLSYRGQPDNAIVKIDFGGLGVKELSAQLAPLTVIK